MMMHQLAGMKTGLDLPIRLHMTIMPAYS